jgi:hypothetical protein
MVGGEATLTVARDAEHGIGAQFLLLFVAPVVVAAAVSFAPPILSDPDTFWHVATGGWILDHGQVPKADPFSFTFAGHPWVAHEWLSEVLLAVAHRSAGWSGVMLLTGLSIGAVTAIMARWLARYLAPLSTTMALVIGLSCVMPSMLARPHIVSLPALAVWTVALLSARASGRAPSPWLLPLMTLWANMHSSFVIGLGLVAAFGLEAALDQNSGGWSMLARWAAFGVGALLAALATPQGMEGLTFPLKVMTMKTLPTITEWLGPNFSLDFFPTPPFVKLEPMEFALLAGAFTLFWRGVRLSAVRAALVLGLVHMTFQHVRQEVLLGVVAPLVIAEPLGRALGPAPAAAHGRFLDPALWPRSTLAAALLALVIGMRLAVPMVRVDAPTAPVSALAHVPPALRTQPVLNDYNFGGYLIFEGVRPYIDGRADMYGDAFVADDDRIQRGEAVPLAHAIAAWRIRWAILTPERPLVGVLDSDPAWRRLYSDKYAVAFVRNPPP